MNIGPRSAFNHDLGQNAEINNYDKPFDELQRNSVETRLLFNRYLAENYEPKECLSSEEIDEHRQSLIAAGTASRLVGLSANHILWPKLLKQSEIDPAIGVNFRNDVGIVKRHLLMRVSDIPRLAVAAKAFDRPKGAKRIPEIAAALRVEPRFIDDIMKESGIAVSSFRDPEYEVFDEYVAPENVKKLLGEFAARRARYREMRRGGTAK